MRAFTACLLALCLAHGAAAAKQQQIQLSPPPPPDEGLFLAPGVSSHLHTCVNGGARPSAVGPPGGC